MGTEQEKPRAIEIEAFEHLEKRIQALENRVSRLEANE